MAISCNISAESTICFVIVIASQLYALLRFYDAISREHLSNILNHYDDGDFEITTCDDRLAHRLLSWTCNQAHDISDLEWQVAKRYYLGRNSLLLAAHCIAFTVLRRFTPKILCPFVIAYSIGCLTYLLGSYSVTLLLLNISISTFVLPKLMAPGAWRHAPHYIFFAASIFVNNMHHAAPNDAETNFLTNICFSWLNAKLLSAAIDCSTSPIRPDYDELAIRFAYLLYFPTLFFGPIYHFEDFRISILNLRDQNSSKNSNIFNRKRIFDCLQIGRYIFWAFFLENILTYFLHSSALLNFPWILASLDDWPLAGFAFSLMLLFYFKYLVLYGTACAVARFDGLTDVLAGAPKCIAHMSRTSYLWRQFDRGLYRFLIKYFYRPLTIESYSNRRHHSFGRQLLASAVCFSIIALWHEQAESYSVLVWVAINFGLLNLEKFASMCARIDAYRRRFKNCNRLEAAIGSPYLAAAYASNILFLSNFESTSIVVQRLCFDSVITVSSLLAILFVTCRLCEQINNTRSSGAEKNIAESSASLRSQSN